MSPTRAVLYVRLSSADDASTSIARQEEDLRLHAEREGWEIVRVLADDGISGRKARANAEECLRMLRDREADVLGVWKFDRWSRAGLAAVAALVDTLDATPGSQFLALRDGLHSEQPAWRIIASVLAEVARMEADNTADRVRSSIAKLRASRRFAGGVVPFGYRTAPAPDGGPGRILEPDPAEADVVREIASRLLGTDSVTSIAVDLNRRAIPTTRSKYRAARNAGKPVDGLDLGRWKATSLRVLMTGEHLLGRQVHNGRPLLDEDGVPLRVWDPILDLATVTRLRARLGDPKAGTGAPRRARAARLLSGLLYCSHCGRKCYVRTSGGRPIYGCSAGGYGDDCPTPRIMAELVESFVSEQYLRVVGRFPELREVEAAASDHSEDLAEVEHALQETSAALTDDEADVPALLARMAALKARRAELRALPAVVESTVEPTGRTLREAWDAEDDVARRRELLSQSVEHVELSMRTDAGLRFDPSRIRIIWTS